MRKVMMLVGLMMVMACSQTVPPVQTLQRQGTEINASVGKTWDETINQFANFNIPIATLERASGFVATKELNANVDTTYYDCGKQTGGIDGDLRYPASRVSYNVRVLGDSTHATVKVTAEYTSDYAKTGFLATTPGPSIHRDCSSKGKFEQSFEQAVRVGAEAKK